MERLVRLSGSLSRLPVSGPFQPRVSRGLMAQSSQIDVNLQEAGIIEEFGICP